MLTIKYILVTKHLGLVYIGTTLLTAYKIEFLKWSLLLKMNEELK